MGKKFASHTWLSFPTSSGHRNAGPEQAHGSHWTIDFLPGTRSPSLPWARRTAAIWLHPAPYGSISLAGALENIKRCCTLLLQPLPVPLHLPSICLCDSAGLLHTEPFVMRTASRTEIKNSTSPPSEPRSLMTLHLWFLQHSNHSALIPGVLRFVHEMYFLSCLGSPSTLSTKATRWLLCRQPGARSFEELHVTATQAPLLHAHRSEVCPPQTLRKGDRMRRG